MNKPLTHSHSSIKQYENCPKQYQMQRITKEVQPSFGEASIHGNRIHEQLELYLKEGKDLPPESAKYRMLADVFSRVPGKMVAEQEFTLSKQLIPTGWWDADAWLRSKLDVLIINGSNAVVADWKTGKRRPDFTQLEMFALQVFKHYPEVQQVQSIFVWVKDMCTDSKLYRREDEPRLWSELMTRIGHVERSAGLNVWPARPSGLCPWCPAMELCEHGKGKRRGV